MGLFDRFKKKDDFDLGAPPDFSQPPGGQPTQQGADPYGQGLSDGSQFGANPQQASAFEHDVFSSTTPTNADNARVYAQSLGAQPNQAQQARGFDYPAHSGQASYAGALTGHEAQLILERLDTIKAELDGIKQRIMRVERFMDAAEQKAGQRKYF